MWRPESRAGRWALTVVGAIFVALGAIGAFVPGLPTVVFLLAACFAWSRSCPAMEQWLRNRAWVRPFLPYLDGARIPKMTALRIILAIAGGSFVGILLLSSPWTRGLVAVLAGTGMVSVVLRSEWVASPPRTKPSSTRRVERVEETS
jgi:uncharacterized membrane protein YbaN (DUF454 family)